MANVEFDGHVGRDQAKPFALRVLHSLLAGEVMAARHLVRNVQAPVHHIDEVELSALCLGQRGRQGNCIGAALVWCVANYVSHG
ncbi:hypothetical protein D9M72_318780 [compost metagenome]